MRWGGQGNKGRGRSAKFYCLTIGLFLWFGMAIMGIGGVLALEHLAKINLGMAKDVVVGVCGALSCVGCLLTIWGLMLVAREMGEAAEKRPGGGLSAGARLFAGLFSALAIVAGGYLMWEGATGTSPDAERMNKMIKFGMYTCIVGVLGLVVCVIWGRNTKAPEVDWE